MSSHLTVPAPVTRLGYLGLAASDAEAMASHYTDVVGLVETGRSGDARYLACGPEHHCLVLEPAEAGAHTRIGLELAIALDDAAAALGSAGVEFQRRSDPDPGIAASLVISPFDTGPIHLYERQTAEGPAATLGTRPTKIGHVALGSSANDEVRAFLENVLGFRWSDSVGDHVHFMRCNPVHHSLNLFARPAEDAGLHHFAFEGRDSAHLLAIVDHLSEHRITLDWGVGRHGPGHNMFSYHLDPAGNTVEISVELDLVYDEADPRFEPRPWHRDQPQRPKVWNLSLDAANQWGPLSPALLAELEQASANAGR